MMSWNVGGLTNSLLDELQAWLALPDHRHIKVVMLQETRWTFSSEWSNKSWTFIHSGDSTKKGAGILTMLSCDLYQPMLVRSRELYPGRLLHVRIPLVCSGTALDLLNTYQYVWNMYDDSPALRQKRARLLRHLETAVQLSPLPGLVGHSTNIHNEQDQAVKDPESLRDLLLARQLVALNTWTGKRSKAYTYNGLQSRTQIDYILARQYQATHRMRACRTITHFPIAEWRTCGMLVVDVDYNWKPSPSTLSRRININTEQLRHDMQTDAIAYQSYQKALSEALTDITTIDMNLINRQIQHVSSQYYPSVHTKPVAYHEHAQVQLIVRQKWQHLAAMRKSTGTTMRQVFMFWRHFIRFRRTKHSANKASRQARRDKYEQLLQEAESHALNNNTHQMFRVIRKLAPKQKYKKVQIYGPQGQVLSTNAEAQAIHTHFSSVFRGSSTWSRTASDACPRPFTHDQILQALLQIPATKATPPHYAPGACWKAAAGSLADLLHRRLPDYFQAAPLRVPQPWKDGWLTLLGKPAKCGRQPSDFRPICLQDPAGKALITVLADRIQPIVQSYAACYPQHAYLPYRSTEGALLNIFHTCRSIRTRCQDAMQNIQNKRFKPASGSHVGGLVLSLDMSSAFDTIPRQHIACSLAEAGVADGDVALVLEWLSGSQYHLRHGGESLSISTTREVRQGCVLSPLLWACLTCYILRRLPPSVGLRDVQAYADDLAKEFNTQAEYRSAIKSIPSFIEHLREFGLNINTSKTVLLLRMATPQGKTDCNQHIIQRRSGTFFRIPGLASEVVPVKPKHTYLGCIISLFDFETETLRHRIQVGRTQYQRLKTVLCSRHHLSLARRTRLWNTCIWTTLTYGLACCGVPGTSMQALQRAVTLQLRSITRLPSHITHVTTDELYRRLGLSRPELRLQSLCQALCSRLAGLRGALSPNDIMLRPQIHSQASYALELVTEAAGQQMLVRVSQHEGVPCPHCGIYFQGETAVKVHIARKHPALKEPGNAANADADRFGMGVDGMPTCRRCGHKFGAWKDLINHVNRAQCHGPQTPAQQNSDPLPVSQRHELVQKWVDGGAVQLQRDMTDDLRQELLQRCCLCRQWIASSSHIKAHLRRSHSTQFGPCMHELETQCGLLSSLMQDPCPYCKSPLTSKNRNRHASRCPVLLQAAFCCRLHGHGDGKRGAHLTLRGPATSLPSPPSGSAAGIGAGRNQQPRHGSHAGRGGEQAATEVAEAERQRGPKVRSTQPRNILAWLARPIGPSQTCPRTPCRCS